MSQRNRAQDNQQQAGEGFSKTPGATSLPKPSIANIFTTRCSSWCPDCNGVDLRNREENLEQHILELQAMVSERTIPQTKNHPVCFSGLA